MAWSLSSPVYDYYLVLDFEATCREHVKLQPIQEIIEFPVVMVNSRTLEVEAEFHQYVRPTVNPQLTPFCTELTGITQYMVNRKQDLRETLELFHDWMYSHRLLDTPSVTFCFVICSDWDLKSLLPKQCQHLRIPRRAYFNKWINIQKVYTNLSDIPKSQVKTGMTSMLASLGLKHEGRLHSGIDDARNTARILKKLARQCPNITATGSLPK